LNGGLVVGIFNEGFCQFFIFSHRVCHHFLLNKMLKTPLLGRGLGHITGSILRHYVHAGD
jgi:hypothetical protein